MLNLACATEDAFDFDALRRREFARLDRNDCAYLDYAATALYGESQLRAHHALLADNVLGNPHSESTPSHTSSALIERARRDVLAWFGVDATTHTVCFTANATAAIKLVAESYPFDARTAFALAADNHNSVNGIREYARRAGAPIHVLPLDSELRLGDPVQRLHALRTRGLFAFPAQSNFSGVRHPLALVAHARALGFDVLVDAAAYAATSRLDLRACPADFAVLSFHKLFGFPTSVGALIARRDALARLRRPWFAGGTVAFASVGADLHRLHRAPDGFEDGTPDFLGIAALLPGFELLEEVGADRLTARVAQLGDRALRELAALPFVRVYGPTEMSDRGATIAFNICSSGRDVPYTVVEARARAAGVALRGGCFCNPGAAEAAFHLRPAEIASCATACGDAIDAAQLGRCLGRSLGREIGAVRLSLGLANNLRDVERAIAVVEEFAL